MQVNIAWRLKFSPTFEADLQNVRVHGSRQLYSDHSVLESAASPVLPRTVEIAGGITRWPHTFGAVFTPWENRAEEYLPSEAPKRTERLLGKLTCRLDDLICLGLVHFWIYLVPVHRCPYDSGELFQSSSPKWMACLTLMSAAGVSC